MSKNLIKEIKNNSKAEIKTIKQNAKEQIKAVKRRTLETLASKETAYAKKLEIQKQRDA